VIVLVFFITFIAITPSASSQTFTLEGTIFERAGLENSIDPLLLYSIALNVSSKYAGKGQVKPSAYAIRSTKLTRHFENQKSAEQALSRLLQETDWIDIGLMQISLHYHPQKDPLRLLDPYENLSTAAIFLRKKLDSTPDPILGVGRYFSSNKKEAQRQGYKIWVIYSQLQELIFEQGLRK